MDDSTLSSTKSWGSCAEEFTWLPGIEVGCNQE